MIFCVIHAQDTVTTSSSKNVNLDISYSILVQVLGSRVFFQAVFQNLYKITVRYIIYIDIYRYIDLLQLSAFFPNTRWIPAAGPSLESKPTNQALNPSITKMCLPLGGALKTYHLPKVPNFSPSRKIHRNPTKREKGKVIFKICLYQEDTVNFLEG